MRTMPMLFVSLYEDCLEVGAPVRVPRQPASCLTPWARFPLCSRLADMQASAPRRAATASCTGRAARLSGRASAAGQGAQRHVH